MKTIKKFSNGVAAAETILILISRFTQEGVPQKIRFNTYGRSLEELRDLGRYLIGEGFTVQGRLMTDDVRPLLKEWTFLSNVDFSFGCKIDRDRLTLSKSGDFLLAGHYDAEFERVRDNRYLSEACQMLSDLGVPKARGEHVLTEGVQVKLEASFRNDISFRGDFHKVADLIQAVIETLPADLPLTGSVTGPLELVGDLSKGTFLPRDSDRWFLGYSGDNLAPSDVPPERVVELIRHVEAHPGGEDALFFDGLTWKNMTKTGSEPSTDFLWTRERGKPAVIRVTSIDPLPKAWITALAVAAEEIVAAQDGIR
ncbi:MAG TPA: hypothetical protein VJ885_19955 [Thermoanaerobaculia bacterium]|jgi:hypothetical protein|nr:hypothetical protein [Thermoanaerobaculia bacterium]